MFALRAYFFDMSLQLTTPCLSQYPSIVALCYTLSNFLLGPTSFQEAIFHNRITYLRFDQRQVKRSLLHVYIQEKRKSLFKNKPNILFELCTYVCIVDQHTFEVFVTIPRTMHPTFQSNRKLSLLSGRPLLSKLLEVSKISRYFRVAVTFGVGLLLELYGIYCDTSTQRVTAQNLWHIMYHTLNIYKSQRAVTTDYLTEQATTKWNTYTYYTRTYMTTSSCTVCNFVSVPIVGNRRN